MNIGIALRFFLEDQDVGDLGRPWPFTGSRPFARSQPGLG